MLDLSKIAKKWQKKWETEKIFEVEVDSSKKKFFLNAPYPYANGYPHIGHLYTYTRAETLARFKRLQGYNVLFPLGFHCTGSPIVSAAKRVEDKEPKQMGIMRQMGFSNEELKKFKDPKQWVKVFPKGWKEDLTSLGFSIDFRRSFITTSMNPQYDAFVRWQFNTLKKRGYVVKGNHPVVWDPKNNTPVGDHDRIKGEGETPQEFTLLKFKLGDDYVVAATLRPETVFGQTNLWIDADTKYVKAKVGKESWIISSECAERLKNQDKKVKITDEILGSELIGENVVVPGLEKNVIILPSHFCDPKKGTGIVTSVPSDAPDDYIGLRDLQEDSDELKKYGLTASIISKIKPIPIIDTPDLGDMAAVKIVNDMDIKNQHDRKKLEEAKKIVYKKGFYEGKMHNSIREYSGMPVQEAKDLIKNKLIKEGKAELFYELTGPVVARSLSDCIVKIVNDQWFLNYSDPKWKKETLNALKGLKLDPEKVREQFEYVVDWLDKWACVREFGLGTQLPWDSNWVIESLSDSTLYMAYYTFAHYIKDIDVKKLDFDFFNYIFFGRGKAPFGNAKKIREAFNYWYPFDYRTSGKDLLQNHLTFCLFNHVAIFDKKYWPKTFGINGWVTVDGQKMSKSLGNMILLRDLVKQYSPDAARITVLNGGEGVDDANWDSTFAKGINGKLESCFNLCVDNYSKGTNRTKTSIDKWFENSVNKIHSKTVLYLETTQFRSAFQIGYFELQSKLRWYLKRTEPNKELLEKAIELQLLLLSPYAPHFCEEAWMKIGKKKMISESTLPKLKEVEKFKDTEQIIEQLLKDTHNLLKMIKISEFSQITLTVSPSWKYSFFKKFKKELKAEKDVGKLIRSLIDEKNAKEISKMVPSFARNPSKLPSIILNQEDEVKLYEEAREFLEKEFKCVFSIIRAEDSESLKALNAIPSKVAIEIK